jgi:ubiquinone/menaquinone biosynthesis C-methylase UbiE
MPIWIPLLAIAALFALLAVWELYFCEGAHLGRRSVIWTYNLAATRYDGIKRFDPEWERRTLGEPVATVFGDLHGVRMLDVGAGTARLGRALGAAGGLNGTLWALEPSRKMLELGRSFPLAFPSHWVQAWSQPLPFADESFDLVASLEMLEFTPHPERTLREMVRVLRRDGWLVVSNRIGWQARLILGHYFSRQALQELLEEAGMIDVQVFPWQMDYDLVWGYKPDGE